MSGTEKLCVPSSTCWTKKFKRGEKNTTNNVI